jgi:anti-sigma factor RsiW
MIDGGEACQRPAWRVISNVRRAQRTETQMSPADPRDEMACQELVEVLTDYLEGTLADVDRRRLEAHVAVCPPCRTYIEQLRQTLRAVGGLAAEDLAPTTRARLVAVFRGWREA